MKKNKLFIFMISLTVLNFVTFLLLGLFYLSRNSLNIQQIQGIDGVELSRTKPFLQKFNSTKNNLDLVLIHFKNPGVQNHNPLFFWIDNQKGQSKGRLTITGNYVSDYDWVRFQFPPIFKSRNKQYTLGLFSDTPSNQPKLQVLTNKGTLVFKAYSRQSLISTLVGILNQDNSKFFADPIFSLLYGIVLVGLVIILSKEIYLGFSKGG